MNKYATQIANRELLDIIRRMAYVAEYSRENIHNHLERIRGYCFVIARGLGLSSEEAMMISQASMLHDVGEIGVPDSILSKTDKLTPYEWEKIKRHTNIGAEILKGSPSVVLQAGEIIALTHHERWDGSGYPQGLKGKEIPLGGRICALADVFDALVTRRSYKTEISVGDALLLIQESSESLFDPELVKVFTENFDDILEVLESHP